MVKQYTIGLYLCDCSFKWINGLIPCQGKVIIPCDCCSQHGTSFELIKLYLHLPSRTSNMHFKYQQIIILVLIMAHKRKKSLFYLRNHEVERTKFLPLRWYISLCIKTNSPISTNEWEFRREESAIIAIGQPWNFFFFCHLINQTKREIYKYKSHLE